VDYENWDLTPKQAIAFQRQLAGSVVIQPLPARFKILGASDIGYSKTTNRLTAVMLAFSWPGLELLETARVVAPVGFPYIPGLLSFREVPPLLEAFRKLENKPEVLLCDGQGIAHPRRVGLASHLGLCLNLPAVGCAKSRLCGVHAPLTLKKGRSAPLLLGGEQVGLAYCSRDRVKPLYISPGHLSDIASSKKLVSRCLGRYRIPEPLRLAHITATILRRQIAVDLPDP